MVSYVAAVSPGVEETIMEDISSSFDMSQDKKLLALAFGRTHLAAFVKSRGKEVGALMTLATVSASTDELQQLLTARCYDDCSLWFALWLEHLSKNNFYQKTRSN